VSATVVDPRAIVLVEGNSDRVALLTLAARLGRTLPAEGVAILAMGGVTNTRTFALRYGPAGLGRPPSTRVDRRGWVSTGAGRTWRVS